MAKSRGVWGIDIGQCALKAVRLEDIGGTVTATAFDYIEHPKILSQPDADPDQLTREALEKLIAQNKSLRTDQVVIGVPGQSGLARFVKLPPVEEKKISDIVHFEAKQQIPFPLEEVVWDFQKIGQGIVTDGFAMETEIGLFAMKRDMVGRFLGQFKDVDVEVTVVQMSPLAVCNYVSYDLLMKGLNPATGEQVEGESSPVKKEDGDKGGKKRCIVALDIGADSSTLVITDGERIIWQRPVPKGGNNFTRALTKDLKLTFAKAEHLKRNATKSPDLKKILTALRPELNEFVAEVQRSLQFFTNTHRDAHVEYVMGMGNAFRLPGLQKFLGEKLQIEVRKLSKLERLSGEGVLAAPSFSTNVLSFGVAYGLALQGLRRARLQTNLLPPEVRTERQIRDKKPWAAAAAAALLVGVGATGIGYSMQMGAISGPQVQAAEKDGNDITEKKEKFEKAYNAKKAEVEANETAVKRIIHGQEERLNWLVLNRFINDCLPTPALRFDGTITDIVNTTEGPKVTIKPAEGKEREFVLNGSPAVLLKSNRLADAAVEIRKGLDIAILEQKDPGALRYWNAKDAKTGRFPAKDAYVKYLQRLAGGKSEQGEDEGVDRLIQVNLEAVNAMYTTDLKGYYANLKASLDADQVEFKDVMPVEADRSVPPNGKGWVVELRGYTYHQGLNVFLLETLMRNLAEKAVYVKETPPKPGVQPRKVEPAPVKPTADKGPGDKGTGEKGTSDKGTGEKGTSDKGTGEKGPGDKTPPDKKSPVPTKPEEPQVPEKSELEKAFDRAMKDDKAGVSRVSHVVLLKYDRKQNPNPAVFKYINQSMVGSLVQGGAAPGGATKTGAPPAAAPGTPPTAAGPPATNWAPLIGTAAAGPGHQPGGLPPTNLPPPVGPVPPKPAEKTDPDKGGVGPIRAEFIILFCWIEPTPSDDKAGTQGPPRPK